MHRMLAFWQIAIIAYVFILLTEEGMIFAWWYKLIRRLPDVLYKPLGGCQACFSGQVSLWYFLVMRFDSYNFFEHLFFVAATILTVIIIDKIINYGA